MSFRNRAWRLESRGTAVLTRLLHVSYDPVEGHLWAHVSCVVDRLPAGLQGEPHLRQLHHGHLVYFWSWGHKTTSIPSNAGLLIQHFYSNPLVSSTKLAGRSFSPWASLNTETKGGWAWTDDPSRTDTAAAKIRGGKVQSAVAAPGVQVFTCSRVHVWLPALQHPSLLPCT